MSFSEYWEAEQRRQKLAAAVATLQAGDAGAHERFYTALKQASLFLPVEALPDGVQNGERLADRQVPVQVKLVRATNSQLLLPLFTSESLLRESHGEKHPFLLISFPSAVQMTLQAKTGGVVLDRGGAASAIVQLPVLLALAKGKQPPAPGGGATAAAGPPVTATPLRVGPPPRVLDYREVAAVGEWLQAQPGLAQAYLFGLMRGNAPPVLSLGLDFAAPPDGARMKAYARLIHDILGPSGLLLLNGHLVTLLARQAGAIHFDLRPRDTSSDTRQPNAPPPTPG